MPRRFANERFMNSGDVVRISSNSFEKEEKIIKVRLSWGGYTYLDLSAIMLDENGRICMENNRPRIDDIVCFRSTIRWKPVSDDNMFEGKIYSDVSEAVRDRVCRNRIEYMLRCYPSSICGGVIGSHDELGQEGDSADDINEEAIYIRVDKIDMSQYSSVAIVATISLEDAKRGERFEDFSNLMVEFVEPAADGMDNKVIAGPYLLNNNELCDNGISRGGCTGICLGFIKCDEDGEWRFEATAKGYKLEHIRDEIGRDVVVVPIVTIANSFF